MAQKRMIDKKISVSEQVANLGEKGALLFTWMIPHADDVGLLPFSSRTIKALVVPMFDYTVEDVDFQLDTMRKSNLISIFQYKDKKYWKLTSFIKEQSGLKRDRQPQTILDCKLNEDPKDSWKTLYSILEDIAPVLVPELKRREVKRNYPKDKEENTKEKPIIPSGSLPKGFEILKEKAKKIKGFTKEESEILSTPEDVSLREKITKASSMVFAVLTFFIFSSPIHAKTIKLTYSLNMTRPSYQLVDLTSHSPSKKPSPDKISQRAGTDKENKITSYPKYLTDQGTLTRKIVLNHLSKYYSGSELLAADNILKKEAGYQYDEVNPIGAGGIPQALPYSKMGCPLTKEGIICQADWFVQYVNKRYGSPIKAWIFHQINNYY